MAKYCSECGEPAIGKFCSHCGTPLNAAPAADFDWRGSCDFERICQVVEVKRRIDAARRAAGQKVSGSQVLQLVDTIAAPLMGGLSSLALAKVAQPMTARLGIKTGKERREFVPLPTGVVLANAAIAFAAADHTIVSVVHDDGHCTIEAVTAADLRAMEGSLAITIERAETGCWVSAAARIDGQWHDWGQCQKRLADLFACLRAAA